MTRFSKIFLRESLHESVQVAIFGKHPAWDDHIDEIGLTTETLVSAKRILYSDGIASQLASGAWDQIERNGQAIEFNHRFVWGRRHQSLIGGIWASSDGKGRARFPMVICFHCPVDTLQALGLYLSPLEALGKKCQAATTREAVHELIQLTRTELNDPGFPRFSPLENLFSKDCDPFSESAIQSLEYLGSHLNNTDKTSSHFRLPAVSDRLGESLGYWSGYVGRYGPELPALSIGANAHPIDLIINEPQAKDFFGLRARVTALPLSTTDDRSSPPARSQSEAHAYLQSFRLGPGAVSKAPHPFWRLFKGE
jgi:hypothetical protein